MINSNIDNNENDNNSINQSKSIIISDFESSSEDESIKKFLNPKIDKKFKDDEKYKINFINTTLKNPKFSLFNSSSNHKVKYLSSVNNNDIESTTIKQFKTKIKNKNLFKSKKILSPFHLYKSIYYLINFSTNNTNNLTNSNNNNTFQFKLYKDSDIFNFSSYLNKNIIINKTDYDTDTDSETLDKAKILIENDIKEIFFFKNYKAKNITFNIKKINK